MLFWIIKGIGLLLAWPIVFFSYIEKNTPPSDGSLAYDFMVEAMPIIAGAVVSITWWAILVYMIFYNLGRLFA